MKNEEIKKIVKEKYTEFAKQTKKENETLCCGAGGCGCGTTSTYAVFNDSYENLEGYNPEADLGLGCGIPTEFALINKGDTVLDLGSGAGNDCFVARAITGETGKVIGVDMTEIMVEKAKQNAAKLKYNNVDFRLGDIEDLPVDDHSIDVVISNCVLNLVPSKEKAFQEIYRVLKSKGHLCVSDVVVTGDLPKGIKEASEMYAGCVAGALIKEQYLDIIRQTGFKNVEVKKEKQIQIPNTILSQYLSVDELREFKRNKTGIYSITVYAEK